MRRLIEPGNIKWQSGKPPRHRPCTPLQRHINAARSRYSIDRDVRAIETAVTRNRLRKDAELERFYRTLGMGGSVERVADDRGRVLDWITTAGVLVLVGLFIYLAWWG